MYSMNGDRQHSETRQVHIQARACLSIDVSSTYHASHIRRSPSDLNSWKSKAIYLPAGHWASETERVQPHYNFDAWWTQIEGSGPSGNGFGASIKWKQRSPLPRPKLIVPFFTKEKIKTH